MESEPEIGGPVSPEPAAPPPKWHITPATAATVAEAVAAYEAQYGPMPRVVDTGVRIPKDPAERAALLEEAGLTDEERAAVEEWVVDTPPPTDAPRFDTAQEAATFALWCLTEGEMPQAECERLAAGVLADLAFDGWGVRRG